MASSATPFGLLLLTIIQICSSQTTSTTSLSTTPATAESTENNFFAATTLEVLVLVGVIIGCPICIAIFCWWQKGKTKKFSKVHATKKAKLMEGTQRRIDMKLQQQQRAIQMQQVQNTQIQQEQIQHGTQHEAFTQNPAAPINASNAKAIPNIKREPSNTPTPPPPAKPAKNHDVALDILTGTTSKPPPPASNPPPAWIHGNNGNKEKKKPSFMKVVSVSGDIAKIPQESALVLPDVESDVDQQPPPEVIPKTKTFDANTGAPQEVKHAMIDSLDWANPDNYNRLQSVDNNNNNNNNDDDLERSISIEDNIDNDNNDNDDDDKKKGDDDNNKMDEDEDEDDNVNMSDSSSGEALDNNNNNNNNNDNKDLLQIAHEQMSSQPPPSLQTIFGRNVVDNKDESDSDEDSLMKRQQQFDNNPDAVDDAVSPVDKPESTFVLNV